MSASPIGQEPAVNACPVRKLTQPGDHAGPAMEHIEGDAAGGPDGIHGPRWVIRSHENARALIRSEQGMRQAGFGALTFIKAAEEPATTRRARRGRGKVKLRPPVLYLEGAEHRARRRAVARFFTPKAIEAYRPLVDDLSRRQVEPLARGRPADVAQLSLQLSVAVVARVIGLSSGVPGMSRRIEATFSANLAEEGRGLGPLSRRLRTGVAMLLFYAVDVLPAIRARRKRPGDDLISHLVDVGFRRLEILTECVIYCAGRHGHDP